MRTALGFKAHSGWAALVVVGEDAGRARVLDRRRVELVEEEWARQPYHAAEEQPAEAARATVERGIKAAHRIALRELRAALRREEKRGCPATACAVLAGSPMPAWSTEQILAVHLRMHQAEGVLFREALAGAAEACALALARPPERGLEAHAAEALGVGPRALAQWLSDLGRGLGPPWGKDQKEAALAALIALADAGRRPLPARPPRPR